MADQRYNFQFVQKLIVFSDDWSKVLLARRYGEADYDGVFSFIGGKMETGDADIITGLRREKSEEVGADLRLAVHPFAANNLLFRKKDGSNMIVTHYAAKYLSGDVALNKEEYSECQWASVSKLDALEPKIPNIPDMVEWALRLKEMLGPDDFVEI